MNAVVQCLSHTIPLLDYLRNKSYERDLRQRKDGEVLFNCMSPRLRLFYFKYDYKYVLQQCSSTFLLYEYTQIITDIAEIAESIWKPVQGSGTVDPERFKRAFDVIAPALAGYECALPIYRLLNFLLLYAYCICHQ